MRRFSLAGTFVALVVLLCLLWAYRFERMDGLSPVRLADLRAMAPPMRGVEWLDSQDGLKLRLRVDPGTPQLAVRFRLPAIAAVELLHFRFRTSCGGLVPGSKNWEDGRFIVEWHHLGETGGWENTPISTVRLDQPGDLQTVVIGPDQGPAIPMLRLEHLGRSGEFDLSDLEITPIRERLVWKIGRWFLIAGWILWGTAFFITWPGIAGWRSVAAAGILVLTGIHFVIPGPWKIQRPIYPEFRLGGNEDPVNTTRQPARADSDMETRIHSIPTGLISVMGEIPYQGGIVLQVKQRISQARPLLHALLMFGPVLAFACLAGRKPAFLMGILLGVSVELAQFGFGYGFGWDDMFDLFTDGAGIALAMLTHRKLAVRFPGRWFVRTC